MHSQYVALKRRPGRRTRLVPLSVFARVAPMKVKLLVYYLDTFTGANPPLTGIVAAVVSEIKLCI